MGELEGGFDGFSGDGGTRPEVTFMNAVEPSAVLGEGEVGVGFVMEGAGLARKLQVFAAVLRAVGSLGGGVLFGAGFEEGLLLGFPSGIAGGDGEEVVEEVAGGGVLIEPTDEVGDGGVEVVMVDDGGVEEEVFGFF